MNFTMNTSQLTSDDLSGILLVDKPPRMTSHDVVYRLRRALNISRIGHAGTLDPLATGLLIMLIGRATKYSQFLTGMDKSYRGTMKFGEITDSYDSDGNILEARPVHDLSLNKLQTIADEFLGTSEQIPPMFSAKKIHGRPLYKLARKGHTVERLPVTINISHFAIESLSSNFADFFVHCSKGTYVRSLVHEFGEKLGCGAHLSALCRCSVGPFSLSSAISLEQACTSDIRGYLIDLSTLGIAK